MGMEKLYVDIGLPSSLQSLSKESEQDEQETCLFSLLAQRLRSSRCLCNAVK